MKILFLGTGGMQPTKDRNPSAILMTYKSENILFDCGEGTQRQLQIAGVSPTKITKIIITHWHGDHVYGLPGLLRTLAAWEYNKTLEIYGPKGTKKYMKGLLKLFIPKNKVKLKIIEVSKEGPFLETKDLLLTAFKLDHLVPCLGYSIKEKDKRRMNLKYLKKFGLTRDPLLGQLQKGKSITYKGHRILVKNATDLIPGKKISLVIDTAYSPKLSKFVRNSDVLIAESTHCSKLKNKAKEYKHLTAGEAAKIAKQSKSKKLILTHIGKRYKNTSVLLKEAKKTFKNTKIAEDFMKI
jgi:ribonuclease Z